MALFNYATRELSAKIVYYGPGLSGKTTNIDMVHRFLRPDQKGRLISLPTETDRTLFFDFLPLDLGQIKGFKVRFHLYTVPGQVFYNATRRLVLQGVDGVVFVADSQADMAQSNEESLKNLDENLTGYGKKLEELPFVIQYNKRDLRHISTVQEMNARLNPRNVPVVEGIAKDGVGVSETLVTISRMVFSHLRKTLLLPGEKMVDEETREVAESEDRRRPPSQTETFEEISDIEEIRELPEELMVMETPDAGRDVTEGFGKEALEAQIIQDTGSAAVLPEVSPAEESLPEGMEILPGAPPIVEDGTEAALVREAGLEEIEIDMPERSPDPAHPKAVKAEIALESDYGELTFLKFETPYVSPEGHAVVPATFMDENGKIVRMRIRITMEE